MESNLLLRSCWVKMGGKQFDAQLRLRGRGTRGGTKGYWGLNQPVGSISNQKATGGRRAWELIKQLQAKKLNPGGQHHKNVTVSFQVRTLNFISLFRVIELHTAHYQTLLLYLSFYSVLILLKLYPRRTKRITTTRSAARLHPRYGTQD